MRVKLFKHKMWEGGAVPYVSPYLLEILSTRPGAPTWVSATGALTANTGQVVSCSRASSAYCLGDDGLLHLLGANTVRVEPTGLLVEGASTNLLLNSVLIGDVSHGWQYVNSAAPVVCTNGTADVTDPTGGNNATKIAVPAVSSSDYALVGQAAFTSSQATNAIWLRTLSGTAQFNISGNDYNNIVTVTPQWQLFQVNKAGTAGQYWLGWNGGVVGAKPAVTVYGWNAQAEALPFATSPIITTSAAATRDADVVTVANPLAALSQPVPAWRVHATYSSFAAWDSTGYPFGNLPLMSNGVYFASVNGWSLYQNKAGSTGDGGGSFFVFDSAGGSVQAFSATRPTVHGVWDVLGTVNTTGPVVTVSDQTSLTPGGLATPTQNAIIYLANNPPSSHTEFCGHATDLYVDNT